PPPSASDGCLELPKASNANDAPAMWLQVERAQRTRLDGHGLPDIQTDVAVILRLLPGLPIVEPHDNLPSREIVDRRNVRTDLFQRRGCFALDLALALHIRRDTEAVYRCGIVGIRGRGEIRGRRRWGG